MILTKVPFQPMLARFIERLGSKGAEEKEQITRRGSSISLGFLNTGTLQVCRANSGLLNEGCRGAPSDDDVRNGKQGGGGRTWRCEPRRDDGRRREFRLHDTCVGAPLVEPALVVFASLSDYGPPQWHSLPRRRLPCLNLSSVALFASHQPMDALPSIPTSPLYYIPINNPQANRRSQRPWARHPLARACRLHNLSPSQGLLDPSTSRHRRSLTDADQQRISSGLGGLIRERHGVG